MTDLEKWKQWLDSWGAEYEVNVYDFDDDINEIIINKGVIAGLKSYLIKTRRNLYTWEQQNKMSVSCEVKI